MIRISLFLLMLAVMALPAFAAAPEPVPASNPQYLFQLSYDDAEGAIGFALAGKGAGSKVAATINGHKSEPIFSFKKPLSVEIRGLTFDAQNNRWNASLLFVAEGAVVSAVPVSGRYEEVAEVPVLKRQVQAGDIIKPEDVELRDFAMARTHSDVITDMSSLIGKSPARNISPSRPIREREIAQPTLVKKNGLVQIRFQSPGMEISASGQAVTDGGKGEVIDVRNLSSKKLVRAVVFDQNTVDIVSSNPVLSSAAQ